MAATTTILLPSHTPHIRANRVVADVVHESDETKCNRYEDPEECLRELKLFHGDFLGSLNVPRVSRRGVARRSSQTPRYCCSRPAIILPTRRGHRGWSFFALVLQAAPPATTTKGPPPDARCHLSIDPPRVLVDRV